MQRTPLYVKPCCFTLDLLIGKCKTCVLPHRGMYIFSVRLVTTLSLFLKNELWTQKKEEKKENPSCDATCISLTRTEWKQTRL